MITGNSGDKILISGKYYCKNHNDYLADLIKDDIFPRCGIDNEETSWVMLEENISPITPENSETQSQAGNSTELNATIVYDDLQTASIYKKRGFFTALNNLNLVKNDTILLENLNDEYRKTIEEEINQVTNNSEAVINSIRDKIDFIKNQISEKQTQKEEYKQQLNKIKDEFNELEKAYKQYESDLREQIKNIGDHKDDLINKRITDLNNELNAITFNFNKLEKSLLEDSSIIDGKAQDKTFYINLRKNIAELVNTLQDNISYYENNILNFTSTTFLAFTGWISAFISSWFFWKWNVPSSLTEVNLPAKPDLSQTGLITFLLDNLRYFILKYEWFSLLIFVTFCLLILIISYWCYKLSIKIGFTKRIKSDDNINDNEDSISFDTSSEEGFNARFSSRNMYEFWLKATPYLLSVVFFIVIIALGYNAVNPASANVPIFSDLSNNLTIQLLGLMIPLSTAALFYFYLVLVAERRFVPSETTKNITSTGSMKTELMIFAAIFFSFIILMTFTVVSNNTMDRFIAVSGFLLGCVLTGMSLAFCYRYLSLNSARYFNENRIKNLDHYINRRFDPFGKSVIRNGDIVTRIQRLSHDLLDISEAKNNLAKSYYNPELKYNYGIFYKIKNIIWSKKQKKTEKEEANPNIETKKEKQTTAWDEFTKKLKHLFREREEEHRKKEEAWEAEIDELINENNDLRNDLLPINDELYFPVQAAKIKELKLQMLRTLDNIRERKNEIESYYREERINGSLNTQLIKLQEQLLDQNKEEFRFREEVMKLINEKRKLLADICNNINEGYNLGIWFRNRPQQD